MSFSLTREGPASVAVFDVHGRLLKRWSWPTSNGVLFYRLEVNGQTLTQKMVHLR